jgi:hypothetical protein
VDSCFSNLFSQRAIIESGIVGYLKEVEKKEG